MFAGERSRNCSRQKAVNVCGRKTEMKVWVPMVGCFLFSGNGRGKESHDNQGRRAGGHVCLSRSAEGWVEMSSENSLDDRPVIASGGGQAVRRLAIRTRDTR
jgi:hypothetical protein